LRSVRNMNGWQDPDSYEASSWKLGTPRGEHVRKRRLQAVLRLLQDAESLVDVGAGPATLSQDFPCEVVACDFSAGMLGKAKMRVHNAIRCDARYLPVRAGSFDVAFESSCLYLVDDKNAMVKEMCRVARNLVVVFESNRLSVRRLYDKYIKGLEMRPEHPTPSEVKRYMAEAALSPTVQMVGFSPVFGGAFLLRIWKPVEWFVEWCPGLRNFAGGILAYAHIDKR